MRVLFALLWLEFAMAAARPALAQQALSDFQTWSSVRVTSKLTNHLDASGESMLSITDHSSRIGQVLLRGILTYRFNERFSIGGGYTYFGVDDGIGARYDEHRILQDLNFRVSRDQNHTALSLRSRLEERIRAGQDGVSFRLRQLTRVDAPVFDSGVKFIAWNEGFYAINRTAWSGRTGVSFMLNFVGLGIPLTNALSIEPGYLNQTFFDPGDDRTRHIIAVFVAARH